MTLLDDRKAEVTPPQPPPVKSRGTYAYLVTGGVLVLIGALWLLERLGWVDITVTAVLALATMVVGISLMVLARRSAHVGLVVFGAVLALVTVVTAAAPFEGFQGGVGDRVIELSSVDDIAADYNLSMGTLTIDLREIGDVSGTHRLTASVGMGELVVRIPADMPIRVEASAGAGEIDILGERIDGVGIDKTFVTEPSGADVLVLELDVFTGTVEVSDD